MFWALAILADAVVGATYLISNAGPPNAHTQWVDLGKPAKNLKPDQLAAIRLAEV